MLTLNLPDLTSYLPIVLLLALAALIGIILLVRAVLHSRLALLIAVISGVVVAGPAAGSIIMQLINALTSLLVIGGILIGAGAILISRSPDLRALIGDGLQAVRRWRSPAPTADRSLHTDLASGRPVATKAIVKPQARNTTVTNREWW